MDGVWFVYVSFWLMVYGRGLLVYGRLMLVYGWFVVDAGLLNGDVCFQPKKGLLGMHFWASLSKSYELIRDLLLIQGGIFT